MSVSVVAAVVVEDDSVVSIGGVVDGGAAVAVDGPVLVSPEEVSKSTDADSGDISFMTILLFYYYYYVIYHVNYFIDE